MANLIFTLESGRKLGVTTSGNPAAERIVVFCHPAPGSSTFDPDPTVSAAREVHILAFDRPGYGSSDPLPVDEWPSVTGPADDIAEYLRAMMRDEAASGIVRRRTIGIVGWSAGGRTALAFAARHPDLVDRVAIVATPAPNEAVQWIDPPLQAMSDQLATLPPDAAVAELTGMLAGQVDAVRAADDAGDVPLALLGEAPVDEAALARPGARDRLGRMLREAYRQGAHGVAADILSYSARPWGFDPAGVAAKTLIVNGRADPLAGQAHAEWYRQALPDARVELVADVGHMVIFPSWGTVLTNLAPAPGEVAPGEVVPG
ncbi:alpha/beta hydrolase [Leifsonia poae]|uniref:alpha/beta hydrolase n=1 Tax=Leifsonia poae TaxID=110933 RepID=UPI001CC0CEB6|nr:alpha/beta hydrolase [Leifsonia poae]